MTTLIIKKLCPRCKTRTLYKREGRKTAKCSICKRSYDTKEDLSKW